MNEGLPPWFQTEGLAHLRAGEYEEAVSWYETESQVRPDQAHGWLGLAAANLALGHVAPSNACLQNALGLAPDFPLKPLLSALPGLDPKAAMDLAEALYGGRTTPTVEASLQVLDWCSAQPGGRRLGGRIKTLRQRCRTTTHVRSLSANDFGRAGGSGRRVLLLMVLFLVCAAAAWFAYEEIEDASWGRRPRHKGAKASPTAKAAPSVRSGKPSPKPH